MVVLSNLSQYYPPPSPAQTEWTFFFRFVKKSVPSPEDNCKILEPIVQLILFLHNEKVWVEYVKRFFQNSLNENRISLKFQELICRSEQIRNLVYFFLFFLDGIYKCFSIISPRSQHIFSLTRQKEKRDL